MKICVRVNSFNFFTHVFPLVFNSSNLLHGICEIRENPMHINQKTHIGCIDGSDRLLKIHFEPMNEWIMFSEVRCPKLAMPSNGGFKCSDGSYFNSRCQFFCSPGYTLQGDRSATCQSSRTWTRGNCACLGGWNSHSSLANLISHPQINRCCCNWLAAAGVFFLRCGSSCY